MFNIGILGLGKIARKMASTVNDMDGVNLYAVSSRSAEKAEAFRKDFNADKAYAGYDSLLQDEKVDLVYIATPHPQHLDMMLQCIKYKKPVLCEKAFTLNTEQAKKVFEQAEKNKVFVAEAIWTRYMPMRKTINDVLNSGIIGTPKFLEANLSYFRDNKPRLQNPEAAGGALLEIGIYPLNFALMAFGDKIKSVDSSVFINDNGVDEQETITINFEDGKMASLNSSIAVNSNRKGIISGDKGYIEIENINNPESLSVYDAEYHKIKSILCPTQITGFEYEVESCKKAIEQGKTEPEEMKWADTLKVLSVMDNLRKDWNLKFPQEL